MTPRQLAERAERLSSILLMGAVFNAATAWEVARQGDVPITIVALGVTLGFIALFREERRRFRALLAQLPHE